MITAAQNPRWSDETGEAITLDVKIAVLGDVWVPFVARANDCEEHGRELHARAMAEEFGLIAPYVAVE